MADYTGRIAQELKLPVSGVGAVAELLAEGCTVPFIARYRKEKTGSLDEVAITAIRDGLARIEELEKRREAILGSLSERGILTEELKKTIDAAATMTALEDAYLPFRPKRRTRALIAREAGLQPLADALLEQKGRAPQELAADYVNEEKGVADAEAALAGARDIIAENVSENPAVRQDMRVIFVRFGVCVSSVVEKKKEEPEAATYADYFDWKEPLLRVPSHRLLAVMRGEKEGYLSFSVRPEEKLALEKLYARYVTGSGEDSKQVEAAVTDGYRRLLAPSMETEARSTLKKRADADAIAIFARNLRELLMASPFGARPIMAIDPGIRTGCKVVCLDSKGDLLHHTVIFIQRSDAQYAQAGETIRALAAHFKPDAVAVGNGTASRETEEFLRSLDLDIPIIVVSESGASVYSASELARKEFPDQDVTVRGAVSIGRRLMDPLAELVKIDPKSIGVGQYQHDVDQKQLKNALDDTVVSCVNAVGVDLNTASAKLLSYVSGLTPSLAENVVKFRENEGAFKRRQDVLKVPRLGPKAYQQAAGFLRIRDAENPLDASAVHPENYGIVDAIAADQNCSVAELIAAKDLRGKIDLNRYVTDEVGLPTLEDILSELEKPGRDPRSALEIFSFDPNVRELTDLEPGMKLPGIVSNVTAFGAFVNIGVHQDGLVHVSQMGRYVKDISTVLHPGMAVEVYVIDVDVKRHRISLRMELGKKNAREKSAVK
ncbi:Tex family protein [Pyramidobacter piscolens]|uniref:Tex family protein n=1 Tax=Pyramidobacter piscolens TaxID=638849 RepID=UPI001FCA861A|nr:Tex family protein [Pyramidobacter piscolens]BDF78958.1 RNA-binding transcriptional accessory protein [Pyramidobacter piscolens]